MSFHYPFPIIKTIDDVLPAIEGVEEFFVAERDGYQVINYNVNFPETFPEVNTICLTNGDDVTGPIYETEQDYRNAMRRECRGLIFDEYGDILSRRFHKFFNLGEKEETFPRNIDINKPHIILNKFDGALVTLTPVRGVYHPMTKMGMTDVAAEVYPFLDKNPNYTQASAEMLTEVPVHGWTLLYEWLSPNYDHVAKYDDYLLVLLAARHNTTGQYMNFNPLMELAAKYHLATFTDFGNGVDHTPIKSMDDTWNKIRYNSDSIYEEGIVIAFEDGMRLKCKTESYTLMHKTRDNLSFEKNVLGIIMEDKVDDLLPFLNQGDAERLTDYQVAVEEGLHSEIVHLANLYKLSYEKFNGDKKQFAINGALNAQPFEKTVLFSIWGKDPEYPLLLDDIRNSLKTIIMKHLSSSTKVDMVRHLWNGAKWNYSFEGDD